MGTRDERIDLYIENAENFAKPILRHLRKLVHQACPEVTETIKWNFPSFEYKGPYCSMASFKKHCVFGFWKAQLLNDPNHLLGEGRSKGGTAMGNLGRITSMDDLPFDEILLDFLRQAKKLNDDGIKLPPKPKKAAGELIIPGYFLNVLNKNEKAKEIFDGFSYSHRREYVEWITEAKTEQTRNKRMTTAIVWLSEGKPKNWKYMKKQ